MFTHTSGSSWVSIGVFAAIGFVLTGAAFVFAITSAQPGSAFYDLKRNGWEEWRGGQHTDTVSIAEYQLTLLERRQQEALRLSTKTNPSPSAAADLLDATTNQTALLLQHIAQNAGSGISATDAVLYTHRLAAIVRAQELTFQQHPVLQEYQPELTELRRELNTYVAGRTNQLVVHHNDEFVVLFTSLLTDLTAELGRGRRSEDASSGVELYLQQSNLLLQQGEAARALQAVLHAKTAILLDGYISL